MFSLVCAFYCLFLKKTNRIWGVSSYPTTLLLLIFNLNVFNNSAGNANGGCACGNVFIYKCARAYYCTLADCNSVLTRNYVSSHSYVCAIFYRYGRVALIFAVASKENTVGYYYVILNGKELWFKVVKIASHTYENVFAYFISAQAVKKNSYGIQNNVRRYSCAYRLAEKACYFLGKVLFDIMVYP